MHRLVSLSSRIDSKDIYDVRRLESDGLVSRFRLYGQYRQKNAVVELHRNAVLSRSQDVDFSLYVAFVDAVRDRSRTAVGIFALLSKHGRVLGILEHLAHYEPGQQYRVDFPL